MSIFNVAETGHALSLLIPVYQLNVDHRKLIIEYLLIARLSRPGVRY